jgi:hypothetical protein
MDAFDDRGLDALLRDAAPRGVRPGFADAVLATARARRRRGRLLHLAVAAAAILALALGARRWLERQPEPIQAVLAPAEPAAPSQAEPPSTAFAAVIPSRGDSTHSVMMARFDGRFAIFARPRAAEADESGPSPRASGGWATID